MEPPDPKVADFNESGQERQRVTLSPHGKKPLRRTHLEEPDGVVISGSSQVPGNSLAYGWFCPLTGSLTARGFLFWHFLTPLRA